MYGNILTGLRTHLAPASCKWIALAQEFGTVPGTTVVEALRAENSEWVHNHEVPVDTKVKKTLLRAFYPVSILWREFVLSRGRVVFHALITDLSKS
jgi:hypothetical protein